MADLLITAQNLGDATKGDLVEARESGAIRGIKEDIPKFVWVVVSDATIEDLKPYAIRWKREIDWEVVSSIPENDQWRIRIFSTNSGAISGIGDLTRDDVEDYLSDFSISVFSATKNEVIVDVDIYQVSTSEAFWEVFNLSGVYFDELDYDQGTGIHRIEADYSETIFDPLKIESRINIWATVISHSDGVIVFDIESQVVRSDMKRRLKQKLKNVLGGFQYHISESDVDSIIGDGGEVTRTFAQVLAAITNKSDE